MGNLTIIGNRLLKAAVNSPQNCLICVIYLSCLRFVCCGDTGSNLPSALWVGMGWNDKRDRIKWVLTDDLVSTQFETPFYL